MEKIYWNDIKIILKTSVIIIIPIIIIIISIYSYLSNSDIEKTKKIILEEQKERSKVINYIIEDTFEEVNEDLLVVKNSNEINNYINQPNTDNLAEAEQLFIRIAQNKKSFDQVRLINSSGKEVIRVDNEEKGTYLVPDNELQNKMDRYYYTRTSQLKNGEIFISDMDLNKENGKIEVPYKPMIRIATPLYSDNNTYQGILIVNYLGQDLLDVFHAQFKDSEYSFIKPSLINDGGYYLYNMDADKKFGFMFEENKDITIAIEESELWNEIKSIDKGYYEKGNNIIFFMKLNPLERIKTKVDCDYNWFIVSEFNLLELPSIRQNIIFGMKYRDVFMLIGTSLLIFILVIVNYYSKKNKDQLGITTRIAENTNDAVVITDHNTNIIYVNNAFEKATGYTKSDVLGLKTNYFKSGKQSPEFYKEMWKSINDREFWRGELWDRKKDGMLYPKKLNIFAIKNKFNTDVIKYVGIFNDLTKTKEEEKYVAKLKNYNLKTNLPNEKLLMILIDKSISNNPEKFGIIYFSILNYNNIMLKLKEDNQHFPNALINRIKDMLKGEDFIAQINNNDFVIGLSSYNNREKIECFLNQFFQENNKLLYLNDNELFFHIKAGVSMYPEDGFTSSELIINAYIALENVLNEKEKKYMFYESSLKEKIEKEIEVNLLLRKAIVSNELSVYYQPQVEIEKEKCVGAEALLRWNNNKLGFISPEYFIPLAEKTGQIIEIGYWLIERIFKDYLLLKEEMSQDFRISINISPVQFNDKELLTKFKELARKYDIDFKNFEVEITESIFMDDISSVNEELNKFKELGMTVAIDDFGTGFSSLSYLKNLNVDKLKIDRSFIKDYPEKDNGGIAKVITNMANELKLKVITEGAETKEQINYLKSIGCNLIQGYYYSRPLPKDDFYKYLQK